MPYLQLDLDAKKKIPHAARIAGIPECQLGWGLMDLWEWCWLKKRETVSLDLLEGFFGAAGDRVARALVAFEFAEQLEGDAIRVRGAKRYLRISEVRSEAGKARAGSTPRDAKGRLMARGVEHQPVETDQQPTSTRPAHAGRRTSNAPAANQPLHRAPNTEHREEDPPPGRAREKAAVAPAHDPSGDFEHSPAGRFFAWMQEVNPDLWRKLPESSVFRGWYSGALRELSKRGMGDGELRAAYEAFLADPWARGRTPPCPWDAWMRKWSEYLPREPEAPPADARPATPAAAAWARALERLRANGMTGYGIQQARLEPVELRGAELVLRAPWLTAVEWVREHYGGLIAEALADDGLTLILTTPEGEERSLEA